MKILKLRQAVSRGFTLIEILTVTAIIGVLASIAAPVMIDYTIKARTTEGVLLLSELRRRVEVDWNRYFAMPDVIPASPPASGERLGGPFYTYENLFGQAHNMFESVEFQHKGPHRVLVLRAYRKEEWGNSDIGLHLQIRDNGNDTLSFRCTINEQETREAWTPSTCFIGNVNDWTSW